MPVGSECTVMSLTCTSCGKSFKRPQDLGQHTRTCDKKRGIDEISVGVEPKPTKTARAELSPSSTGAAGDYDPEVVDYEGGNDFEDTMPPSSPPAPARVGMFGYVWSVQPNLVYMGRCPARSARSLLVFNVIVCCQWIS